MMTSEKLNHKFNLHHFSLAFVWLGAAFAICASFFKFYVTNEFPTTTFVVALIAVLASIPVYRQKIELNKRNKVS